MTSQDFSEEAFLQITPEAEALEQAKSELRKWELQNPDLAKLAKEKRFTITWAEMRGPSGRTFVYFLYPNPFRKEGDEHSSEESSPPSS